MSRIVFVSFFILCLLSSSFAVPYKINYQGVLKDSSGNLFNGKIDLTFAIYNDALGENPASAPWSETQTGITVEAGLYSVQLGSVNPISPEVFLDGKTKYLGVTAGTDSEMLPRIPLISVPYAMHAERADAVNGLSAEAFVKFAPSSIQSTPDRYGIWVESTNNVGYGVYGRSNSTDGRGVEGDSIFGTGVRGYCAGISGLNIGVEGITISQYGYGGHFKNFGGGTGILGETTGEAGQAGIIGAGVCGLATDTTATVTNYGVYGESVSSNGIGVYGIGSKAVVGFNKNSPSFDYAGTYGMLGGEPFSQVFTGVTTCGAFGQLIPGNWGALGYFFQDNNPSLPEVMAGVYGFNHADLGAGVRGETNNATGYAGYFEGGLGIKIPTKVIGPSNPLPSSAEQGTMFFDPTSDILYIYNGTTWITK